MTIIMIRNEQGVYRNKATENGVNNTSCTMHSEYCTKQRTWNFKTAYFPPRSVSSKTESRNN